MASQRRIREALASPRTLLQGLVVLGLGMVLAGSLAPDASGQSDVFERERVTLEGSHTDVQFLAGRSVRVSADVADDVFAAGRDVNHDIPGLLVEGGFAIDSLDTMYLPGAQRFGGFNYWGSARVG